MASWSDGRLTADRRRMCIDRRRAEARLLSIGRLKGQLIALNFA